MSFNLPTEGSVEPSLLQKTSSLKTSAQSTFDVKQNNRNAQALWWHFQPKSLRRQIALIFHIHSNVVVVFVVVFKKERERKTEGQKRKTLANRISTSHASCRSGMSDRIMGEPNCSSCWRDSMSAGFMRWTSSQSARSEAESGAESPWLIKYKRERERDQEMGWRQSNGQHEL